MATTVNAGQASWDLNDPNQTNDFVLRGTGAAWVTEEGGNGYLQITPAVGSLTGTILFGDFDDGLVVKAFTFECDVKIGDGTNPPADGFSINYARSDDPTIANIEGGGSGVWAGEWAAFPSHAANLPEEGTQTGIAIGFDTWGLPGGANGANDLRGISIRVDGAPIAQFAIPNVVPPAGSDGTDPSFLETGPWSSEGNRGTGEFLTWQPLRVDLDEAGILNVFFKNTQILTNFDTGFFPSPGRLVFTGRTGGSYAVQAIDNLSITTIPSETFLISGLSGRADGFVVTVNDAEGSILDPDTVSLQLNGEDLDPTSYQFSKVGNVSTISYSVLPNFLPSGSTNQVSITAQDNNGTEASLSRSFTVRPYIQLDPAWIAAAADYDTGSPGFVGSINQIAVGRSPGDANNVWNALRHLAGGYIDPATGNAYANLVDPAGGTGGVDANGNFEIPDATGIVFDQPWININQGVNEATPSEIGSFTSADGPQYADYVIPGIPGTTLGTDNIVAEAYTYLELTGPELYTFVVNSDDGFRVSFGPDLRSAVFTAGGGAATLANAGQFNGGKGSSDVQFDVVVPDGASGVYLTRLLWWEGGGGANLEFFTLLDDGAALVGDTAAGGLPSYKPSGGSVQSLTADVVSTAPWPGQTGVRADSELQIIIADGSSAVVDANSITVSLNGEDTPLTTQKEGANTRVTVTPDGLLDSGATYQVEVNYTAGGEAKSASYSFTVVNWTNLPAALATAPGTGSNAGMRWRTYQTAAGHGTTIAGAENALAGGNGPDIHDPAGHSAPQDSEGFFQIDWVNFEQGDASGNPVAAGNFSSTAGAPQNVPDELIPGIPGTTGSTDNIAAEALTFLDLDAGFHQMVVNSDDGFLVTAGTADSPKFLSLGQFDAGRGAADTTFYFNVEQAGVYFFRLLWFEGGGGASVEWFTVNVDSLGRILSRDLVGGQQAESIPAFRTRTVPEPELPSEATFDPPTIDGGAVTLTWTGTGILQESSNLTDWSAVTPAPTGNTYTVTPDAANPSKFYRIELP